jgi:hypothetical protein
MRIRVRPRRLWFVYTWWYDTAEQAAKKRLVSKRSGGISEEEADRLVERMRAQGQSCFRMSFPARTLFARVLVEKNIYIDDPS